MPMTNRYDKWHAGDPVLDRYTLDACIGAGSVGQVWTATDSVTGERVAIRVLDEAFLADPKHAESTRTKARLYQQIHHPNLLRFSDFGHQNNAAFVVTEFLQGITLNENLVFLHRADGSFSLREAVRIGAALADAVAAVHKSTLHLHITPRNIFLCESGVVKLMEFAIPPAGYVSEADAPEPAAGPYSAPELSNGNRIADRLADQYALASVIIEMLLDDNSITGMEESLQRIRYRHGRAIYRVLRQAVAPNPKDRHATMAAFSASLQRGLKRRTAVRRLSVAIPIIAAAVCILEFTPWSQARLSSFKSRFRDHALTSAAKDAEAVAQRARRQWKALLAASKISEPAPAKSADECMTTAEAAMEEANDIAAATAFQDATKLYETAKSMVQRAVKVRSEALEKRREAYQSKLTVQDLAVAHNIPLPRDVAAATKLIVQGDEELDRQSFSRALVIYTEADGRLAAATAAAMKTAALITEIAGERERVDARAMFWRDMAATLPIPQPAEIDQAAKSAAAGETAVQDQRYEDAFSLYQAAYTLYDNGIRQATGAAVVFEEMNRSRRRAVHLAEAWNELVVSGYVSDSDTGTRASNLLQRGKELTERQTYLHARDAYDKAATLLQTRLNAVNETYCDEAMERQSTCRTLAAALSELRKSIVGRVESAPDEYEKTVLDRYLVFCDTNIFDASDWGQKAATDRAEAAELHEQEQYALAASVYKRVNKVYSVLTNWATAAESAIRREVEAERKGEAVKSALGNLVDRLPTARGMLESGDELLCKAQDQLLAGETATSLTVSEDAEWIYGVAADEAERELRALASAPGGDAGYADVLANLRAIRPPSVVTKASNPPGDQARAPVAVDAVIEKGRVSLNGVTLPAHPHAEDIARVLGAGRPYGIDAAGLVYDHAGISIYLDDDDSKTINELRFYFVADHSFGWSPKSPYKGHLRIGRHHYEHGNLPADGLLNMARRLTFSGVRVNIFGGVPGHPNIQIARLKHTHQLEYVSITFGR